jgi:hypothetical protein
MSDEQHHEFGPSRLHRLAQCPGSHFLSQGLAEEPESEYAAEGKMLHAAVAGDKDARLALNPEQAQLVHRIEEFIDGLDLAAVEYERRVTLRTTGSRELLFGTADLVAVDVRNPRIGYVADWKFGRAPVSTPSLNLQAAAYAAAWAQEKGLEAVHAYIFSPRLEREPSSFTFADPDGIVDTIAEIIQRCESPAKTFKTGDHCRWCPARHTCPKLREESALVAVDAFDGLVKPENAAEWFDRMSAIHSVSKEILAKLKLYVVRQGEVPGLDVVEVPGAREVDVEAAFMAASEVMTPDEFRACVRVQITPFERAFSEAARERGLVPTLKAGKELLEDKVTWTRKPGTLRLRRKK